MAECVCLLGRQRVRRGFGGVWVRRGWHDLLRLTDATILLVAVPSLIVVVVVGDLPEMPCPSSSSATMSSLPEKFAELAAQLEVRLEARLEAHLEARLEAQLEAQLEAALRPRDEQIALLRHREAELTAQLNELTVANQALQAELAELRGQLARLQHLLPAVQMVSEWREKVTAEMNEAGFGGSFNEYCRQRYGLTRKLRKAIDGLRAERNAVAHPMPTGETGDSFQPFFSPAQLAALRIIARRLNTDTDTETDTKTKTKTATASSTSRPRSFGV